jgi:hypothetical protein
MNGHERSWNDERSGTVNGQERLGNDRVGTVNGQERIVENGHGHRTVTVTVRSRSRVKNERNTVFFKLFDFFQLNIDLIACSSKIW